jgi:hypothetical protein
MMCQRQFSRVGSKSLPTDVFEELLVKFRDDHIYINHGEEFEITPATMEGFWTFLSEQCERFDCSSVLIEGTRPKRQMDTVGAFSSGVEAAAVVPHLWLALCFHDYTPDELSELFRQAARNRGANVHFFSDRDKALRWLRANNPHFD